MLSSVFSVSDEGMQVVTPPMDTIQEESEAPPLPPYSAVHHQSQLNVNSGCTTPVTSPHHVRKHGANSGKATPPYTWQILFHKKDALALM